MEELGFPIGTVLKIKQCMVVKNGYYDNLLDSFPTKFIRQTSHR